MLSSNVFRCSSAADNSVVRTVYSHKRSQADDSCSKRRHEDRLITGRGRRPGSTSELAWRVPLPHRGHTADRSPHAGVPKWAGAQLRADIAHAATQLVATDGAQGLTLRAVARKAGITAPSIYLHFPVLAEILEALADTSFEMLADYMRRAGERCTDPVSRLPAACHAYVAFGKQYPNEYAIMFTDQTDLVRAGSAESVETVRGAEAFELVLEPLRACIDDSVSGSTELEADATALLGSPFMATSA